MEDSHRIVSQAAAERKVERASRINDPMVELMRLKGLVENQASRIAVLEKEQIKHGDEYLTVAPPGISLSGRLPTASAITGFEPFVFDVCVGGLKRVTTLLYDGFREP